MIYLLTFFYFSPAISVYLEVCGDGLLQDMLLFIILRLEDPNNLNNKYAHLTNNSVQKSKTKNHLQELRLADHIFLPLQRQIQKEDRRYRFAKEISQLVEFYESMSQDEGEAVEFDKRAVLDLSKQIFHGKEEDQDTQQKIRQQYQNEQGQLSIECFKEEVNWYISHICSTIILLFHLVSIIKVPLERRDQIQQ